MSFTKMSILKMYTMQERKPIMLNTEIYIKLRRFIESYSEKINRSYSFSDAIGFLLRKPFFIYTVDENLRDYVLAFLPRSPDMRMSLVYCFSDLLQKVPTRVTVILI